MAFCSGIFWPEFKKSLIYEIRKNYPLADIVSYLPLDTPRNARKFIRMVHPEKAFFIKYEYWYFYISELKKHEIPLYLISSVFRENQPFFKKNICGRWYHKILFQTEHFFVQDEKSAELLSSAGIHNFSISGDTRFDRVAAIAKSSKKVPVVEKFRNHFPLIVAGSTWKPDEEILAAFINKSNTIKMIVAPHEVSETNINRLQQMLKKPAARFSEAGKTPIEKIQVLLIDSIGMLSSLYRYGNIAYIGGGFGVGIHNILEPATFGLPVVFGPNYTKFKEAVELISLGGAFPVHNFKEFEITLKNLWGDPTLLKDSSNVSKKFVEKNVGSTNLIIRKVFNK
ncbi:MAG: glycosyltransferase N-terminal domain-containing protein [Candidatus Aminicenantes bacterium]